MLSFSGRAAGLQSAVRAVTQSCGGRQIQQIPYNPEFSLFEHHDHLPEEINHYQGEVSPPTITSYTLSKTMLTRKLTVSTGIGYNGGQQLRYLHNDIKVPDFDGYRREKTKNPLQSARGTVDERRLPMDLVRVTTGLTSAIAVKKIGTTLLGHLSPAESTLALGVIEIDLTTIPEGKNVTIKWNNKPVFVRHRTAEEIARERAVDPKELRDPQTDEERSMADPTGKWLVVMANCTHLGCVPISHQGNWGGYYCPCHGSHYDAAGRVRKGPAPLNLEVPDHHIVDQNKLILGAKAPA